MLCVVQGAVISLVTNEELVAMREMERLFNTQIDELPLNVSVLSATAC